MTLMRMPKAVAGRATVGQATASPVARDSGATGSGAAARRRGTTWHGSRLIPLLRRHWLVSILLLAGLVLRVLAQLAYRPALLYIDSLKYVYNAWPGTDPVGYKVPLKMMLLFGNLETVAAVQHLLGLAMAVAIYAVLRRRGARRWLAALAVAPMLLDAYQLQMEQTIMPDAWFEAVIVGGLALLLWRPRPALWMTVAAGLTLGASATIRQVGEILIVPALIYLVLMAGGRRAVIVNAVALCCAFAVPIVVYCSIAYVETGHFRLSRSGSSSVYGRIGEAVDCATLKVPAYEQPLCPTPPQKALGADGLDHSLSSPLSLYVPPGNLPVSRSHLVSIFERAVLTQQPLSVLTSWASDSAKLFALNRLTFPGDTPIWRWQFQDDYPTYGQAISINPDHVIVVGLKNQPSGGVYQYQALDPSLGGKASVIQPLANFLRHYQLHGGYTPGPLYAVAVLAGLIGSLGVARRGSQADRQLAVACLLFFTTAVGVLLASDLFEFSWRYQLPALVTLPPAGALGIAVILGEIRRRKTGRAGQDASEQRPRLTAPSR
jgi:hypothetical protein